MIKKEKIIILLCIVFMLLPGMKAYAAENDTVVVLGADLSAEQRAAVLELMELTEADLAECTVIYVTNAEEHQYLDSYIDSAIIGTRALTSVKMTKAEAGAGILVTTRNVNYCTTGMYRNALLTAGVEDRNVMVVAPTPVSGTAGLVGAVKAYEASAGVTITDEAVETALNEMVVTGELSQQLGSVNNEDVEAFIAWLKSMMATGKLDTSDETSIRNVISEGEQKFGVTLSEEEKTKIVDLLKKLDKLGLNGEYLTSQAENLYKKYGMDVVNQASEVIGEAIDNAVSRAAGSFFESIKTSLSDFFSGLFKR